MNNYDALALIPLINQQKKQKGLEKEGLIKEYQQGGLITKNEIAFIIETSYLLN